MIIGAIISIVIICILMFSTSLYAAVVFNHLVFPDRIFHQLASVNLSPDCRIKSDLFIQHGSQHINSLCASWAAVLLFLRCLAG